MRELIRRELYVIAHGQSARTRIFKYLVLFAIFGVIYYRFGGEAVAWTFGVAVALSIAAHFFFRWKTKGWEEDWWLYKSLFK